MVKKKPIKEFKGFLGKLERFVDRSIPFWMIILTVLIVLENPLWVFIHLSDYPFIGILESLMVLFFFIDLVFKWFTVRHWSKFVRLYWLDIIAIFPFYLVARVWISITALARLGEELGEGQKFLHEFLLFRETELIREARLVKESGILREIRPFIRMLRTLQRFLRFLVSADLRKKDIHYKK